MNRRYSRYPGGGIAPSTGKSVDLEDAFAKFQKAVNDTKSPQYQLPSLDIIDKPTVNSILGLFANYQRGYVTLEDICRVLGVEEKTVQNALGIE